MRWNFKDDTLVMGTEGISEHLEEERPTKRRVVGAAATIFDPLGILTPVPVLWKMLFQSICKEGIHWDQLWKESYLENCRD